MGTLNLATLSGGKIGLVPTDTDTDKTISVPAASGNMVLDVGAQTLDAKTLTGTPSINGGAVSGLKNRCINGLMEVSQRGDFTTASASVSGTYYLDRWFADHIIACNKQQTTGNSIPNLGTSCKAFKLIATASGTGYLGMAQRYEFFSELGGKQVTLSAYVKSNNPNARLFIRVPNTGQLVPSSAHTGGGGWEKLSVLATISAGLTSFEMWLYTLSAIGASVAITSGDYIEATGFQLKDGDCRNELYNEWRPYPIDEMLCQRYLPITDLPYNITGPLAFAVAAGTVRIGAPFKVTPRVKPTNLTVSGGSAFTYSSLGTFYAGSGSPTFYDANLDTGYASLNTTGTIPTPGIGAIFTSSGSNAKLLWGGCEL